MLPQLKLNKQAALEKINKQEQVFQEIRKEFEQQKNERSKQLATIDQLLEMIAQHSGNKPVFAGDEETSLSS